MPDINDLGLPPEPVGDIDYNAPEPGSFPPQIKPGTYSFVFHLGPVADAPASDYFDTVEIEDPPKSGQKRKFLQVLHHATTTVQRTNPESGEVVNDDVTLNYQRVNFYKHPKMPNSSAGDLIRALDMRVEGALTPQAIAELFKSVDGRRSYLAEVVWRMFCQTCDRTVSTAPRKKKGDVPWPKANQNGDLPEMAECPQCHQKKFAQAEINRYKLPQQVEQQAEVQTAG